MVNIWVTKYALSTGITKHEAEIEEDGYARVQGARPYQTLYYSGKEFRLSRDLAILDAWRRQAARTASLKKQIAKLEALTFEDTPE